MAKTATPKKGSKHTCFPYISPFLTNHFSPVPSVHSRASKHAPLNLNKLPLPASKPSILSIHHGAGITKRKAKGKPPSRQQRLRQERGMERAEIVRDVRAQKMERSLGREKVGKERGAAWEELNSKIAGSKKRNAEARVDEEGEWEDEDLEGGFGEKVIDNEGERVLLARGKEDVVGNGKSRSLDEAIDKA